MKIQNIQSNQSLFDVALLNNGTLSSIIDLCVLNNLAASDDLEPGLNLNILDKDYGFKKLVEYLNNQGIIITTEVFGNDFYTGVSDLAQGEITFKESLNVVLENQSVFDLCSFKNGTIESIIDFCLLNQFSPSDDLIPGSNYEVQLKDYNFSEVVSFFKDNKFIPVTDYVFIDDTSNNLIYLIPAGELPYSL